MLARLHEKLSWGKCKSQGQAVHASFHSRHTHCKSPRENRQRVAPFLMGLPPSISKGCRILNLTSESRCVLVRNHPELRSLTLRHVLFSFLRDRG